MKLLVCLCPIIFLIGGCGASREKLPPAWGKTVSREVDALGIQNWIIIAESSFPVVSRVGVRTLVVDAEVPELVDYVVNHLESSENVNPTFNTARELPYVSNDRAPGIDQFRKDLKEALHGHEVRQMDNRSLTLLAHSDASKFAVLVLKSKTALPYSSVFVELDSGYWDRGSEDKLRLDMRSAQEKARVEQERIRQELERTKQELERVRQEQIRANETIN